MGLDTGLEILQKTRHATVRSVRNAGKDTRSPVPGTTVLSLSGHPLTLTLSCSLEIAKASGPADVRRLGLRISAGADILVKN